MAQPTWNTLAGSIGTFNESVPISYTFVATPSTVGYTLEYTLLNGVFPPATVDFSLDELTGVLTGTAAQVSALSEYSFTIRVKQYNGTMYAGFSDRTFSMKITGTTVPTFVTPAGSLFTPYILDSTWDPYQILINNPDPNTTPIISLISGNLPPGLEINSAGLIQGYATPPVNSELVPVTSSPYIFTLQVLSESGLSQRQFSITVQNQELLPGYVGRLPVLMNTQPPSFNISVTDSNKPYYTQDGNLGTFSKDNYFIFKLLGNNFNSETIPGANAIVYNLDSGTLPPGISDNTSYSSDNVKITIDPANAGSGYAIGNNLKISGIAVGGVTPLADITFQVSAVGALGKLLEVTNISGTNVDAGQITFSDVSIQTVSGSGSGARCIVEKINSGWITGTIGGTSLIDTYTFTYTATSCVTGLTSDPVTFNMIVVGQVDNVPIDLSVTWSTASDLGTINNGSVSIFAVEATAASGLPLVYTLSSGTLPPNLELLTTGEIVGRLAFECNSELTPIDTETPFTFTVEATNSTYPEISSSKTFTIIAYQKYAKPYENLYIEALLSENDRSIVASLLTDISIIPPECVYRPSDPYFGKATNVTYSHMYGVPAATEREYIDAVNINHYWRNILLGPVKTAVARNDNNEIIYEVVYSEIIDDLVNRQGVSISKEIVWPTWAQLSLNQDTANSITMDTDMTYYDTDAILKVVASSASSSDNITLKWFTEDLELGMNLVGPNITNDGNGLPPTITAIDTINNVITVNVPQTLSAEDYIIFYEAAYVSMTPGYAKTLYPNSLYNMRQQIADTLGFLNESSILPLWMQSQQITGDVLGYTPCWVICYTKPGYSETVRQNILENWNHTLNQINFGIDRFEVDKTLTWNYNPTTETWAELPSGIPFPTPANSKNVYIYFPRKTILPSVTQRG